MASPEQMVTVAGAVTAPPCACKPVIGGSSTKICTTLLYSSHCFPPKYYKQLFYKKLYVSPAVGVYTWVVAEASTFAKAVPYVLASH